MSTSAHPNYAKYTVSELESVLRNIDRNRFPDRLAAVERELELRLGPVDTVQEFRYASIPASNLPPERNVGLKILGGIAFLGISSFAWSWIWAEGNHLYCRVNRSSPTCTLHHIVLEKLQCPAMILFNDHIILSGSKTHKELRITATINPLRCSAPARDIADTIRLNLALKPGAYDSADLTVAERWPLGGRFSRFPIPTPAKVEAR